MRHQILRPCRFSNPACCASANEHHFIATSEQLFECSRSLWCYKSLLDTGNCLACQSKPQFEQTAQ